MEYPPSSLGRRSPFRAEPLLIYLLNNTTALSRPLRSASSLVRSICLLRSVLDPRRLPASFLSLSRSVARHFRRRRRAAIVSARTPLRPRFELPGSQSCRAGTITGNEKYVVRVLPGSSALPPFFRDAEFDAPVSPILSFLSLSLWKFSFRFESSPIDSRRARRISTVPIIPINSITSHSRRK